MRRIVTFIGLSMYLLAVVSPIADAWEFAGSYGGGCYPALMADPHKPDVLFLGSDVAGIWKSTDGGAHWTPSSRGLGCLNIAVIALGDHVIYAGTKSGLYKSIDGGIHWKDDSRGEKIAFKRPGAHRAIHIGSGDDPQIVLGTRSGNIFVGSANGKKWKTLGTKPFGDIAVDAVAYSKQQDLYYASSQKGFAVFDPVANIWRLGFEEEVSDMLLNDEGVLCLAVGNQVAYSSDGGKTWLRTDAVPKGKVTRIDVRKAKEKVEIIAGVSVGWKGSVYISENWAPWKKISTNAHYNELDNPTRKWMKGFQKPTSVSFDPHHDQTLFYTDWWGVFRSDDLGQSWKEIVHGSANATGSDMFIDERGTIYVALMDQGVLSSSDGGASYKVFFPNAKFPDGGHAWAIGESSADVLVTTFTPWNRQAFEVLTGDSEHLISKSSQGLPGQTPKTNTMWGRGYPRALAFAPEHPDRYYLGIDGNDGGGLFVSGDKGAHWRRLEIQPGSLKVYNGLVVSREKIFWGASGKGGGVYVSEDGGTSWGNRLAHLSSVFDLARTRQGVVFAAGSDGQAAIYRSQNDGETWTKVFELPDDGACEALAVHPLNENFVAAGVVNWGEKAGGRVIISKDGGDHWLDITGDMPEASGPADLAFHPTDGYLYALLYAGSVYKMKVDAKK